MTEHLQHAYALTAHTIQGGTVEWAGVVGHPDDFTRNWSYTALSRARQPTELFLIDAPTERELDRADIAPHQPAELRDERTPVERLEAAMRRRDDEDLALDRIDHIASRPASDRTHAPASPGTASELSQRPLDQLRTELAQLHEQIGHYPEHLADQLHAARSARSEAQRAVDQAAARVAELERPARGLLRRRTGDPTTLAFERERLKLAEHHAALAADRKRDLAAQVPDRATWQADRRGLRERVAELETQLSTLRREHLHDALEHPAPYLLASLGEPPDQPRARHTWRQAAHASRPTASTMRSLTTKTPSAHDPTRRPRAHTGSKHTKTFTEPSTSSASASNAASGTSSEPSETARSRLAPRAECRRCREGAATPPARSMPERRHVAVPARQAEVGRTFNVARERICQTENQSRRTAPVPCGVREAPRACVGGHRRPARHEGPWGVIPPSCKAHDRARVGAGPG